MNKREQNKTKEKKQGIEKGRTEEKERKQKTNKQTNKDIRRK